MRDLLSLSGCTFWHDVIEHLDILALYHVVESFIQHNLEGIKHLAKLKYTRNSLILSKHLIISLDYTRTMVWFQCNHFPSAISAKLLLEVIHRCKDVICLTFTNDTKLTKASIDLITLSSDEVTLDQASYTIHVCNNTNGMVSDLIIIYLTHNVTMATVAIDVPYCFYSTDRDTIHSLLSSKVVNQVRKSFADLLIGQDLDTELLAVTFVNCISTNGLD